MTHSEPLPYSFEWAEANVAHDFETASAEQIIEWLDEYREFMFEIWKNDPELKEQWNNA